MGLMPRSILYIGRCFWGNVGMDMSKSGVVVNVLMLVAGIVIGIFFQAALSRDQVAAELADMNKVQRALQEIDYYELLLDMEEDIRVLNKIENNAPPEEWERYRSYLMERLPEKANYVETTLTLVADQKQAQEIQVRLQAIRDAYAPKSSQ